MKRKLLEAAVNAFNEIPNTRLKHHPDFNNTYAIASAIDNALKNDKPNRIELVPKAAKAEWYNIEVHPVKEYTEEILDGGEVREVGTYCEQCEPGEEDFWSVYLRQTEGVLDCIADLPTEKLANDLADLIRNAVKHFKKEDEAVYSLCEAVADIAFIAGNKKYYSGDSRADIADFISWAKEFEKQNEGVQWGIDEGREYMEEIFEFADLKIKSDNPIDLGDMNIAILHLINHRDSFKQSQVGYIETQKSIDYLQSLVKS